ALSSLPLALPLSALAQTVSPGGAAALVHDFKLPAGALANTVESIARTSGVNIVTLDRTLPSVTAPAINGRLTAIQALQQAVAGSSLSVLVGPDGTLSIVDPVQMLQRVQIFAKRSEAETSFKADYSNTATRSGASLMETPQSVTVITSKVLESQQILSVQEALVNVSGVSFQESTFSAPTISIRGLESPGQTVNGISDSNATRMNVYDVERIEVLKGPQAILLGSNALGGAVNVVTKKPSADPIRSVQLQYGSHNDATAAVDLSDALTANRKLSYRFIGSTARASGSAGGFDGRKDHSISPQLRWKDASTDFIVSASYAKQRVPIGNYTFADRMGRILPKPDLLLGTKSDGMDIEAKRLSYQLKQELSPTLTFVSRAQRALIDTGTHAYSPGSSGLHYVGQPGTPDEFVPKGTINFYAGRDAFRDQTTSGDHYLRLQVQTGALQHKLSVGINHSRGIAAQQEYSDPSSAPPLIPFVYPAAPFVFKDPRSVRTDKGALSSSTTTQYAAYMQELMSWGDWNLLLNLRRGKFKQDFVFSSQGSPDSLQSNEGWVTTPGAGIVYNVSPTTSLYASWAQGFSVQGGISCAKTALPPLETTNKEVGAKFDLFDSKLGLTVSAFDLLLSNLPQFDVIANCSNVRDGQRNKGLEVDLQGQLYPGLSALLNYSHTTIKDVGDPSLVVPGQPRHKLSLWATYELPKQVIDGLGFGLGLTTASRFRGTRVDASQPYAFDIPGQAQFDASVFYTHDRWTFNFGIKNLADRQRLYGASYAANYVPVLDGRRYMLTVKHEFK
ncbi:MAG: TonB-dependent siderophore receptor, partial [Casimicrobiaceae bacterium]